MMFQCFDDANVDDDYDDKIRYKKPALMYFLVPVSIVFLLYRFNLEHFSSLVTSEMSSKVLSVFGESLI